MTSEILSNNGKTTLCENFDAVRVDDGQCAYFETYEFPNGNLLTIQNQVFIDTRSFGKHNICYPKNIETLTKYIIEKDPNHLSIALYDEHLGVRTGLNRITDEDGDIRYTITQFFKNPETSEFNQSSKIDFEISSYGTPQQISISTAPNIKRSLRTFDAKWDDFGQEFENFKIQSLPELFGKALGFFEQAQKDIFAGLIPDFKTLEEITDFGFVGVNAYQASVEETDNQVMSGNFHKFRRRPHKFLSLKSVVLAPS